MTLKEWRLKRKWSQVTLAQELGVWQSTISKWEHYQESGEGDRPSIDQAAAIERMSCGKVKATSWAKGVAV